MKKINSIQQLKAEKARLSQRRGELEKAMKYDWRDIKESIRPANLAKQAFSNIFKSKEAKTEKTAGAEPFSKMAGKLVMNLVQKLGKNFSGWFRK